MSTLPRLLPQVRQQSFTLVAACHLAWRAGGHIWLATDDWYRLRAKPLASGPAWTLMAGDDELAEIRPLPNHGLEIDLVATPADVGAAYTV